MCRMIVNTAHCKGGDDIKNQINRIFFNIMTKMLLLVKDVFKAMTRENICNIQESIKMSLFFKCASSRLNKVTLCVYKRAPRGMDTQMCRGHTDAVTRRAVSQMGAGPAPPVLGKAVGKCALSPGRSL